MLLIRQDKAWKKSIENHCSFRLVEPDSWLLYITSPSSAASHCSSFAPNLTTHQALPRNRGYAIRHRTTNKAALIYFYHISYGYVKKKITCYLILLALTPLKRAEAAFYA